MAFGVRLSTPKSPTGLSVLFLRNFPARWNSRSHFLDWWMVVLLPPLPTLRSPGGGAPQEKAHRASPQGLFTPGSLFNTSSDHILPQISSSSTHSFPLLFLDYGVRPKHPWPRGPRPLLSQAQQRKRDGPDMAEYYYDAHL